MPGVTHRRKGKQQQQQQKKKSKNKEIPSKAAEAAKDPTDNNGSNAMRWKLTIGVVLLATVCAAAWGDTPLSSRLPFIKSAATTTPSSLNSVQEKASNEAADKQPPSEPVDPALHSITRIVSDNRVLERLHHDDQAFTQGLEFDVSRGHLVEGTGNYGYSNVRHVSIDDGTILKETPTPDGKTYFGEGIALFHETKPSSTGAAYDRILQLTWREKTAFIYDAESLELLSNFSYSTITGEGWGVAYDDLFHEFFVSDGSDTIMVWSADAPYQELRRFRVTMTVPEKHTSITREVPIKYVNELEWDASTRTILANVWYENALVRIRPENGHATHVYNLGHLYPMEDRPRSADCLNGIAKVATDDDNSQMYWLTGKLWPYMFRVELGE